MKSLDVAGRALHVALHSAQHGAGMPKPAEDLSRALERVEYETWAAAARLADELGGSAAFAAGLRLHPRGVVLADRLGLADEITADLALRLRASPQFAQAVEWVSRVEGWVPKLELIARKTFPPPAYLKSLYPIARRGGVSLALAYVLRLALLASKAWPALRAWRQATKTAGSLLPWLQDVESDPTVSS